MRRVIDQQAAGSSNIKQYKLGGGEKSNFQSYVLHNFKYWGFK